MEKNGVKTNILRPVDFNIAPGVQPDMTKYGWKKDDWPKIHKKVMAADILIICSPIWLGDKSSVCTQTIERLYANSHILNDQGQYAYYGRVGGTLITGNEDGAKHCAMNILYSLQHLGYTIPPQADAAWLGEVGPGPSYLDKDSSGPENDFTNRNTTFMTWNLMHMAKMIKKAGFSADVLISSLVFWIWSYGDSKANKVGNWWVVVVLNLVIGLSCALPYYLYLREKQLEK